VQAQSVDQTYTYPREISSSFTDINEIYRFPGGNVKPAEMKIAFTALCMQSSRPFKRFDYWTNLSYPFIFYFVTLSEQNILFKFQKVVILIEKMS
jgi:hypothetical protein